MIKINKFMAGLLVTVLAFALYSCDQPTSNSFNEESAELSEPEMDSSYIVVFKSDATDDAAAKGQSIESYRSDILQTAEVQRDRVYQEYNRTIAGFAAELSDAQLSLLRTDPRVDFIEKDRIVQFAPPCGTPNGGPCDGDGGGDDDGGSSAQETPYGITRVNGGATYTGTNVAWILDSGVDLDHPDLNVDASLGFNAFTKGKDGKSLDDGNGHGTHVAGTIAALDNSTGVIGVAAGATVVPVKILDSRGSGSYSGVIAGVDHVAANGTPGDVANMSLGGPTSDALDTAVKNAAGQGIYFVIAAGNSATDANNSSPARANGQNIYTISAMDSNDQWASFSNYGNPPVDFAAPGVSVLSTWKDGGYNTISGTSMAAPHTAGVLLLGGGTTDGTVIGDPDGDADLILVN